MAKLKSISSKHLLEFTIEKALEDFDTNGMKPLYTEYNEDTGTIEVFMFPENQRGITQEDRDKFRVAKVLVTMLKGVDQED